MATPRDDLYPALASGATILRLGLPEPPPPPPEFDSVSLLSDDIYSTLGSPTQAMVVQLHESGGGTPGSVFNTQGKQFRAACSGLMAYETYTTFSFGVAKSTLVGTPTHFVLRPNDWYGKFASGVTRESMHFGFQGLPGDEMTLITRRRYEAMMAWAAQNLSFAPGKTCLRGGSMGAWGTMLFGLRRPDLFAALYPDRPRVRYSAYGKISFMDYRTMGKSVEPASAPLVRSEDGGGSLFALMDHVSYVKNPANKIPWIGWCVGWNDGYTTRQDHVEFVAAMRAAKRGFAFEWNTGGHTSGPGIGNIVASYPYGTFEIGKGYPLFTNHSGDKDPAIDDIGGINIGLSFRNVVESKTGWSCEVTSILGPRTVTIEPISDIFKASVTPKNISIPTANEWVPVAFSA